MLRAIQIRHKGRELAKWGGGGVLGCQLSRLYLKVKKKRPRPPAQLRRRRMQILYELRYPTRWYTKLLMALLALVFFAVLATMAIAGFLVYRIVKPQRTSSEINMASFPGRPEVVEFEL